MERGFKKRRKNSSGIRRIIIFMAVFTVYLLMGACSSTDVIHTEKNNSFVVYVKEDGIYYSYLNKDLNAGREVKIQEGKGFSDPLASENGRYIAYTKDHDLFVYDVEIGKLEELGRKEKVFDNFYSWWGEKLIYSEDVPGIYIYDPKRDEIRSYLEEEQEGNGNKDDEKPLYHYNNFKVSPNNQLFAGRYQEGDNLSEDYPKRMEVVSIDLKKMERGKIKVDTIVEAREDESTQGSYHPSLSTISLDGRYVFVKEKLDSKSMKQRTTGIGVYDIKKKKHTDFTDIFAEGSPASQTELNVFPSNDNIAVNPSHSNVLALVRGGYEESYEDNDLVLMKIANDSSYELLPLTDPSQTAMTPSFTMDGKRLLYSSTKKLSEQEKLDKNKAQSIWEKQPHHIYEYDVKSETIRQITNKESFDYMPISLSEDEILILRVTKAINEGYLSKLIRIHNGEESVFAEDVITSLQPSRDFFVHFGRDEQSLSTQEAGKGEGMESLYQLRGTKIGDNSSVGAILSHVEFPKGLNYSGMKLYTDQEPYGLEIEFRSSPETIAKYNSTSHDYLWRTGSTLLFSLIDNLGTIKYTVEGYDYDIVLSYMDRASADSLLRAEKGYGLSEVVKNEKNFDAFYRTYWKKRHEREDKIQGMTGYLTLHKDKVTFHEVEIVELEDEKRIEELDLKEEDLIGGYAVVDGVGGETDFELSPTVFSTITDVEMKFVKEQDGDRLYSTTNLDEIRSIFGFVGESLPQDYRIPVFIEVLDGKVITIIEKVKYTS